MKRFIALFSLLFSLFPLSVGASIIAMTAQLDGLQETPPNASPATGSADLSFDDVSHILTWDITFSGLVGGPPIAAHFHGPTNPGDPAGPGIASPIRVNIGDISGLASPMIGDFDLDDLTNSAPNTSNLLNGLWYINIHNAEFPGGEIRGQVVRVPEPASLALLGIGVLILALTRNRHRRM